MISTTLVIMAAGMGSRYGGIKQLESVGPQGEIIMDYSVYDAVEAGFNKVIFIIRQDIEKDFKEIIGRRIEKKVPVEYVYQDINQLPKGFSLPQNRTKPWGTGQAILSCLGRITTPFAVVNADDFYGKEAFQKIHEFLIHPVPSKRKYHFCMAGFLLGNTLSVNGTVTRGICFVDEENKLLDVVETSDIAKGKDYAYVKEEGREERIPFDRPVSMNMWGFTPDFLEEIEKRFPIFLNQIEGQELTAEFLLPTIVGGLIKEELAEISVLPTHDKWFGVTYKEDKEYVVQSIKELILSGKYPENLWG